MKKITVQDNYHDRELDGYLVHEMDNRGLVYYPDTHCPCLDFFEKINGRYITKSSFVNFGSPSEFKSAIQKLLQVDRIAELEEDENVKEYKRLKGIE